MGCRGSSLSACIPCAALPLTVVRRLDYVGITVHIVASIYPLLYFLFYCHPNLALMYLSISTFFGIICFSLACS